MNEFNNNPQTPPNYNPNYQNYNAPQKPKKAKKGHSTWVVIISSLLAAIIGATSGVLGMGSILGISWLFSGDDTTPTTSEGVSEIFNNNKDNVTIKVDENASSIAEAVAKKCTDSVVGIRTTTSVSGFFGGTQEQSGDGSGVVYTSDGYIITNDHIYSSIPSAKFKIITSRIKVS